MRAIPPFLCGAVVSVLTVLLALPLSAQEVTFESLLREMNKRPLTQQQHDALVLTLFSFGEDSPLPEKILQAVARV